MIGISVAAKKEWKSVLEYYHKDIEKLDKYLYVKYVKTKMFERLQIPENYYYFDKI